MFDEAAGRRQFERTYGIQMVELASFGAAGSGFRVKAGEEVGEE